MAMEIDLAKYTTLSLLRRLADDILVPLRLQVRPANLVDGFDARPICYRDLAGGDADDRSIPLMQRVDIWDSIATYHGKLEAPVCEPGDEWSRYVSQGSTQSPVDYPLDIVSVCYTWCSESR